MADLTVYASCASRLRDSQPGASVGAVMAEAALVVLSAAGHLTDADVVTAPLPSVGKRRRREPHAYQ
jgi:hypothetical protein